MTVEIEASANGGHNEATWSPRVRKIGRDGKIVTLVSLEQKTPKRSLPKN